MRGEKRAEEATHISVLILDKLLSVAVKFIQESSSLMRRTVLKDTLKYTTTVRMSRETVNLAHASIRDEVKMFGRNSFESALKTKRTLVNVGSLADVEEKQEHT